MNAADTHAADTTTLFAIEGDVPGHTDGVFALTRGTTREQAEQVAEVMRGWDAVTRAEVIEVGPLTHRASVASMLMASGQRANACD